MRLSWAIVAGLAIGGGLGWWWLKQDRATAAPAPVQAAAPTAAESAGPRLYRWRDAAGTLQVSDVPPADRPYEEVKIRSDQNIVPLSETPTESAPESSAPGG